MSVPEKISSIRMELSCKICFRYTIIVFAVCFLSSAIAQNHKSDSINVPVAAEMQEILNTYKESKLLYDVLVQRYGPNAPVVRSLQTQLRYDDSITLVKVMTIINTWGLRGKDYFGEAAPMAMMITFMHASDIDQKKYFPFMAEAVKKGLLPADGFAIIADVIALRETGEQVYGTQLKKIRGIYPRYEPLPIAHKAELDARRQAIGLSTFTLYVSHYNPANLSKYYFCH